MNKQSMATTLNSVEGLITYVGYSPVDFRHSEELAKHVQELRNGLDGEDYFNRRLDLLIQSLRNR